MVNYLAHEVFSAPPTLNFRTSSKIGILLTNLGTPDATDRLPVDAAISVRISPGSTGH
jgi:hypothetical protein